MEVHDSYSCYESKVCSLDAGAQSDYGIVNRGTGDNGQQESG